MLARSADNLFWIARYVERADFTARMIDATLRLDALPRAYGRTSTEWESALAAAGSLDRFREHYARADQKSVISFLAFDDSNPGSIRNCIVSARNNARAVRTALTQEMWETINAAWMEMQRRASAHEKAASPGEVADLLDFIKRVALEFDGSAYRTMLRNDAYWFNRLGLYIERSDNTARILDVKYHVLLPEAESVGGSLDYFQWNAILRSVSAATAFHWVYRESVKPWLVADLLVLRKEMPRSLVSCYENITRYLDSLGRDYGQQGAAQRHARTVYRSLQDSTLEDIFGSGLHGFLSKFLESNNRLGALIAEQYLLN